MAAFDFPNAPVLDQTYTANGVTYKWNGYAWVPQITLAMAGFMQLPAGIGMTYWGLALPAGCRWCDGAQYDPALYVALFAAIGSAFNTGGETAGWFRVPDSKGRVEIGRDDMGGTAANRITTAGAGFDGKTLGARGGAETNTLTIAQLPVHDHGYTYPSVASIPSTGINFNAGAGTAKTTTVAGSGNAHPNVQPGIICNKIITTGGVS